MTGCSDHVVESASLSHQNSTKRVTRNLILAFHHACFEEHIEQDVSDVRMPGKFSSDLPSEKVITQSIYIKLYSTYKQQKILITIPVNIGISQSFSLNYRSYIKTFSIWNEEMCPILPWNAFQPQTC